MKKIRNIFVLALFIFLCNIGNVGAKEVSMSCRYFLPYDQLTKHYATSVLCEIYDDNTHRCYLRYGPTVSINDATANSKTMDYINNWNNSTYDLDWVAKNFVKENKACPPYLLVRGYEKEDDVSLFGAAPTEKDAVDLSAMVYDSWGIQTYIAKLESLLQSTEKLEKAEKEILEYTEILNSMTTAVDFDSCIDMDKIITRIDACKSAMVSRYGLLYDMQNNVTAYIRTGLFQSSDQIITDFNNAMKHANAIMEEGEERLRREQAIIDSEMGKPIVIPPGPSNPDGNDGNKCELFGPNVDPIVSWLVRFIYIFVPVFIIIASIIDFVGVALSGEDKNFKKAGAKLIKRLIIGAVITFLPILIVFIVDLSGVLVPYGIDSNEIFCSIF